MTAASWESAATVLRNVIAVIALVYAYYTWRTRVPIVTTQRAARKLIIDRLRRELAARPGETPTIVDLGSGLGGLALAVARAFPQARVIGREYAAPAWLYAEARRRLLGRRNLRFERCDFWTRDLADADIVLVYLGDVVMQHLSDKLRAEPRANRLILSNTFPLPGWQPVERVAVPVRLSKEIIVYRQD